MTTVHAYPFSDLRSDYVRAVIGLLICLTPSISGVGLVPGVWVFLACAALFAVYLIRTFLKHMTRIEVSEEGVVSAHLVSTKIAWQALTEFRLSYYSTWRRGGGGWMQLRLRGTGPRIRIDSTTNGFEEIVRQAVLVANRNHLSFNEATVRNLAGLKIDLPDWEDAEKEAEEPA